MKLKDIEKFVKECFEKDIKIPSEMVIVCSDWNKGVPEEFRHLSNIEFSVQMNEEYAVKINIAPANN